MMGFDQAVERAKQLGTDPVKGLTSAQVEASRNTHGDNQLPEPRHTPVRELFVEALKDKTLLILMGAAALSVGVEVLRGRVEDGYRPHFIDGIAIMVAVAIASLVATLNQARAQKEFRSLRKVREDIPTKVRRDGRERQVSIFELVVGDIVEIGCGDRVPADGMVLRGVDLAVDQSTLTGESVPVEKGESDLDLKAGSVVTAGSGTMLVLAVGRGSALGQLHAQLTETEEDQTPLQARLSSFADRIGIFGLGSAVATFLALAGVAALRGELNFDQGLQSLSSLLQFSIIAVTIVVVAVPEGLPLAVTISLAYSSLKMARDKCLVRKLVSCETMGAATVVCSDKTGTLTKNQMSVAGAWIDGRVVDSPTDAASFTDEERELIEQLFAINSTALLEHKDGQVIYLGNPSECALLMLLERWGVDWRTRRNRAHVTHQFSFNSERKRMSTLTSIPGESLLLLTKGAPEIVLGLSSSLHTADGVRPLTVGDRNQILEQTAAFSQDAKRTLALAYRELPEHAPELGHRGEAAARVLEENLVFFGLVAIADPIRPEVAGAIAASRAAGVDVKMVTGDHRNVGEAIARELALLMDGDVIMDGAEFREKSDAELVEVLPRLRVLARSMPDDKYRLVSLLKAQGQVVAVTGDGTNDAPALKDADVGFSMGICGTEVAKEASDIVLVDDNFASIVRAIHWGRAVFENIQKFLQFQLTVNVVALSTAFLAAVMGLGVPLNTVQLLWVNLLMDTLAALALAAEPPRPVLLKQAPHGRTAPLVSRPMWTSILAMSTLMVLALMVSLRTDWIVPADTPHAQRMTFVFNAFVMMQLFNEINARAVRFGRHVLDGLFGSTLFLGVLASTAFVQILIVNFGGKVFSTVPMSIDLWWRSIGLGVMTLVAGVVIRRVGRALRPEWDTEGMARY